jgi:DHA1 family bicyclomycin/chloramphenicol resistance-like MFS transporter
VALQHIEPTPNSGLPPPIPSDQLGPPPGVGLKEFIVMIAAIMAINALGIDIMLPALPALGHDLHIPNENDRQWIISAYMIGFGVTQLIYGPLSDWYGRKPILIITVALYALMALAAAAAPDFASVVAARVLMGMFAGSTRILTVSIVRDRFSGRHMARVVSLAFMVFLAVPIIAPALGKLILVLSSWHAIFVFLALFATCTATWIGLRMPETLHPEYRRPIRFGVIMRGFRAALTDRGSLGYTLAMSLMFGALLGFLNSSQQLFDHVFHDLEHFPLIFALIAFGMVIAAATNSRIVGRFGPRRVSHTAVFAFIAITTTHLGVVLAGWETMWSFTALQSATMICFGLASSNFGALAMERMGELAGTAASVQGFISTLLAAVIGLIVGQLFDGTVLPIVGGYFLLGWGALAAVLWAERGKLFLAHHEDQLIHA